MKLHTSAWSDGAAGPVLKAVPDWPSRAACLGMDTAVFFPDAGANPNAARKVCDGCPVKAECGEFALWVEEKTHAVSVGIYGGLSADQRERMRRERRRLKRAAA